jgi:hypothetical protein
MIFKPPPFERLILYIGLEEPFFLIMGQNPFLTTGKTPVHFHYFLLTNHTSSSCLAFVFNQTLYWNKNGKIKSKIELVSSGKLI